MGSYLEHNAAVSNTAICCHIKRQDQLELYLTDFESNLLIEGKLYLSASGFCSIGPIYSFEDPSTDSFELCGILQQLISKEDILTGLYDKAEVIVMLVKVVEAEMSAYVGEVTQLLKCGWIGQIRLEDFRFTAKVVGKAFDAVVGERFSATCRARFCDERCGLNQSHYSHQMIITGATNKKMLFSNDLIALFDHYRSSNMNKKIELLSRGHIIISSGANNGILREINTARSGYLELLMPLPYELNPGDTFTLVEGCDKEFSTCCKVYNNALNFRGEPHILSSIDKLRPMTK